LRHNREIGRIFRKALKCKHAHVVSISKDSEKRKHAKSRSIFRKTS